MEVDLRNILIEADLKQFGPKAAIEAGLKILVEAVEVARGIHRELILIRQYMKDSE